MAQQQNHKINKIFAERLRALRGNLSQADFAHKLGLGSQQRYANYEKGRVPKPFILQQISQQTGVTVAYLLGEDLPVGEKSSEPANQPPAIEVSVSELAHIMQRQNEIQAQQTKILERMLEALERLERKDPEPEKRRHAS